ncbi:MAG: hypothetical protein IIU01_02365 [Oscillospiraceae bacterium]|nr:hypothetical protein [Oscillospiraceae bacterium]MBQ5535578.1 hypothetical protein [Oscillospiraceae bacterium]
MDGYERIEARIREDTRSRIAELEQQTAGQLAALRAEFDARYDRERAAAASLAERTAQERYERLLSAARMEAEKLRLAAQQELLGEAFDLAMEKLCAMPEEKQVALLSRLAHEASPRGEGKLIFADKDRALGEKVVAAANQQYGAHFVLADETRPLRGGFILSQGEVEVNCAYETLIRMGRDELEHEAAQRLFA